MRLVATITLLLLMGMNGCQNLSCPSEDVADIKGNTFLVDKMEANLMTLFNTAAENRNALSQDSNTVCPVTVVRILSHRLRVTHNANLRHALLSTSKPVVSGLVHHSVTRLIAFPKEYHVFRLRRILI